ncbi:MAG: transporter substrate-binding domain-containing protein [Syntrophales bacterium]
MRMVISAPVRSRPVAAIGFARSPAGRCSGGGRAFAFAALILLLLVPFVLPRPAAASPLVLTAAERSWLAGHPVIRLAPDPEFKPIEYFDSDGSYQGIAADNVRLLEKKLGIRFEIVRTKDWDEVMDKFWKGEVDALGAIVATPNRRTFMRISEPLFNVPGAILVRKSVDPGLTFDRLSGMTVAVVSNYTAHDIIKSRYPDIRLDVVPNTIAGLRKVAFGVVDAYVENLATASFYLQESAITNVHVAGDTPFLYQWGIGIRKDWPEFEAIVNKGIASLTRQERSEILDRWLPVQKRWVPTTRFVVVALAGAGTVLLMVIFISNRLLRREVERRTAALNHEITERRRMEEEVRALNSGLEQRVAQRTAELEREIAERKKAVSSLEESRNSYAMLVNHIPIGITMIDTRYRVVMTNKTIGTWLRRDPAGFAGGICYREFEKREAPCPHCPGVVAMRTGRPAEAESTGTRDDGERIDVKIMAIPLGPAGAPTGFIELVEDVTDRSLAKEERQKLEGQLIQAQKMEAIGHLAGGIAHDFNNILSAIIGYASMIQLKMPKDHPIRPTVEQILAASQRATALTQGLLAFSRKQIISPQPLEVNENIRRLETLLQRIIGEDIDFRVDYGDSPLIIMADPGQLDQALINLVTNARDAMPRGGTLLIGTSRVNFDLRQDLPNGPHRAIGSALIEVNDTGMGMDEVTQERIFEPFFTTKEEGKGTGLGLSTVYGFVKQSNGHIVCTSDAGKGTTFRIYMPLIEGEVTLEAPPPKELSFPRGSETVLLAEDNEQLCELYCDVLGEFGYEVIVATDGLDAVEQFRRHRDRIDLVILDVIMPKKNGRDVWTEVRRERSDVRVLFTSGYTAEIIHQQSILDKDVPFIAKPASPQQFLQKVREVLSSPVPGGR